MKLNEFENLFDQLQSNPVFNLSHGQQQQDHMVWVQDTRKLFGYKISFCSCGEAVEVSADDHEILISNELHTMEHYWRDDYMAKEDQALGSPLDLFYSSISNDLFEFDRARIERVDGRLSDIAGQEELFVFSVEDPKSD